MNQWVHHPASPFDPLKWVLGRHLNTACGRISEHLSLFCHFYFPLFISSSIPAHLRLILSFPTLWQKKRILSFVHWISTTHLLQVWGAFTGKRAIWYRQTSRQTAEYCRTMIPSHCPVCWEMSSIFDFTWCPQTAWLRQHLVCTEQKS